MPDPVDSPYGLNLRLARYTHVDSMLKPRDTLLIVMLTVRNVARNE